MWLLRPDAAEESGRILRVADGAVKTIGRMAPADFILDEALISRVHCRLTATNAELTVEDLDSTNGTFVNGRRIDRSLLVAGDRLRLGRVELEVAWE